MSEVDAAIEEYKGQLIAEAELARGDLEEIEDHLRALTADLQTAGLPATEAVREAARRLGEPRALAREHARVRSVFGAALSPLRRYSAVAILVAMLAYAIAELIPHRGNGLRIDLIFGAILTAALAFRLSWARPILIGGLSFIVVETAVTLYFYPESWKWLVGELGILAFLVPWSRRELTAPGWALVLQVWSYAVAMLCAHFVYSDGSGDYLIFAPAALVSATCAVVATCGAILRARWAAFASLLSAGAFAVVLPQLWGLRDAFGAGFFDIYVGGSVATAIVGSLGAAVLNWRSARSRLGTFQHVFR